jgi:hypothetical protein
MARKSSEDSEWVASSKDAPQFLRRWSLQLPAGLRCVCNLNISWE